MSARRLVVVVTALAVVMIGWNALMAAREGWVPEGDGATITLRTHDVISAHPPLLGNPTTAGRVNAGDVYHPGPLEFVLLALPLRVFGADAHGMLWGTAAVNAASVLVLVWFARRRGGPGMALWAAVGSVVLLWSLGNEILHDPYNPHIVLLPLAALLVLVWSISAGDLVAIPFAVAAASLITQSHAYDAIPVAVLGLWAALALVLRLPTGRREPPPRDRRRWLLAGAALGVVLWLPPIVDQVVHRPGNLRQLVRFARDGGTPVAGFGFAFDKLADYLVPPPRWFDRDPTFFELVSRPSRLRDVGLVILLAAAVWLAVRAWRDDRRTTALLIVTALVAALGSTLTAARLPDGSAALAPYNHRHWWPTAMFFWLALGWAVWEECRDRVPARHLARVVATAAAAVLAVSAASRVSIGNDRGSASFGALRALTVPVADAVRGAGPVLVEAHGAQAVLSIEPGLVIGLVERGIDARVVTAERKTYGDQHTADEAGTHVVILSGPEAPAAPVGGVLIGTYDARLDQARGFVNAGVSGQFEVIAVYVIRG
ncbi:MAG: hypothetical protein QOE63_1348 [Acidimicrobiaceae bacterium]|jgi:hypothetical protein